jgi:hypothetical protein
MDSSTTDLLYLHLERLKPAGCEAVQPRKMAPKAKMGRHPKVSLTQSHIGSHMIDPFRVEVVQLDLVVVKEPHQERVRGITKSHSWKLMNETMELVNGSGTSSELGSR